MTETVEAYIQRQPQPLREICGRLRQLVLKVMPDVKETIKWKSPHYELGGQAVCYIANMSPEKTGLSSGGHINLGFWRGAELNDPFGIVEGSGKNLRHVKIHTLEQFEKLTNQLKTLLIEAKNLAHES